MAPNLINKENCTIHYLEFEITDRENNKKQGVRNSAVKRINRGRWI